MLVSAGMRYLQLITGSGVGVGTLDDFIASGAGTGVGAGAVVGAGASLLELPWLEPLQLEQ